MKQNEYIGYVISRNNINDSDRIITIFTHELGKKSFIAKGIRKPKAKLQSQLEPLVESKFRALGNSKLPTLVSAFNINKNLFFEASTEVNISALFVTEIINYFLMDSQPNNYIYEEYSKFLQKIISTENTSLCLSYYLLKILSGFGLEPDINPGLETYWIDIDEGVISGVRHANSISIPKDVVKLWSVCLNSESSIIDRLKIKDSILVESLNLLISYISQHADRKIKSTKVLMDSTSLLQAG